MATEKDRVSPKAPPRKVDTSIVGKDRREALRAQAKKQVEAEAVKLAEAQLLAEMVEEEQREKGIKEPMTTVFIDLAPYADRITIDGRVWFQGMEVTVRESVAAVMHEMMGKTWKHQAEIDGKSENFYRSTRGAHIGPGGAVTQSNILRA